MAGAVLVAATLPFLGWGSLWTYLTRIGPAHRELVGVPFNLSVTGLVTRLTRPTGWTSPALEADALGQAIILVGTAALLVATACVVWRARPAPHAQKAAYGLLVVASLVTTPMNGHYNLIVAFLPLAIALAHVQATWPCHLRWLLLVLLLLGLPIEVCDSWGVRDVCLRQWPDLSPQQLPWRQGWANLLAAGPFLGLLTLWALLLRLTLERPGPETAGPPASDLAADVPCDRVPRN